MSDRFDGKKIGDLGFDAERIKALQSHVSGAGKDHGKFGYSAKTEHHFKELDNPTSEGSIEADMRKIGEHLGYQHAGTLNHDKVRDFIMSAETAAPDAMTTEPADLSPTAKKAVAYTQAFDDYTESGGYVAAEMGNDKARQKFMNDYKLNLQKSMKGRPDKDNAGDENRSDLANEFLKNKNNEDE